MKSFVRYEKAIVLLFSVIIVCLSLFQTVAFLRRAPSDATYPLVHGYAPDYYWYLSLMEQGREGKVLLTSRYTSEIFPPQFINTFFSFLGILAGFMHVSHQVAYLVSRIFFGLLILVSAYGLLRILFNDSRMRFVGFVMIVLCVPFWFIQNQQIHLIGEVWSGLDPIVRNVSLPHHMAASSLYIFSILLLYKSIQSIKKIFALFGGVVAAFSGWLNPASTLMILTVLLIASVLYMLSHSIHRKLFLFCIGIYAGLATLPLPYFYYLQNSVFPWTAFRDWERYNMYPVDITTAFGSIGLIGILAWLAVPSVLRKRNFLWDLVVGWFCFSFVGLGILQYILPLSNSRYLQGAFYIPTALLATVVVFDLDRYMLATKRGLYRWVLAVLVLVLAIPSYIGSIQQQLLSVDHDARSLIMSVPNQVIVGIEWLAHAPSPEGLVLAPEWVSTLLPAFTDKRVFLGHPTFTYDVSDKQRRVGEFYQFSQSANERQFLLKMGVSYIWIEGGNRPTELYLSSLGVVPVYENSAVHIYRVLK